MRLETVMTLLQKPANKVRLSAALVPRMIERMAISPGLQNRPRGPPNSPCRMTLGRVPALMVGACSCPQTPAERRQNEPPVPDCPLHGFQRHWRIHGPLRPTGPARPHVRAGGQS